MVKGRWVRVGVVIAAMTVLAGGTACERADGRRSTEVAAVGAPLDASIEAPSGIVITAAKCQESRVAVDDDGDGDTDDSWSTVQMSVESEPWSERTRYLWFTVEGESGGEPFSGYFHTRGGRASNRQAAGVHFPARLTSGVAAWGPVSAFRQSRVELSRRDTTIPIRRGLTQCRLRVVEATPAETRGGLAMTPCGRHACWQRPGEGDTRTVPISAVMRLRERSSRPPEDGRALPDGEWFVHIDSAEARQLKVNVVEWRVGERVRTQLYGTDVTNSIHSDGENDYVVVDPDDRGDGRTIYTLDLPARLQARVFTSHAPPRDKLVGASELRRHMEPPTRGRYFWLEVRSGVVRGIEQQYLPYLGVDQERRL